MCGVVYLDALITTEGLTKFFGDIPALSGLDLKVPKGISGFIGPNGAGKTTTINILIGLLKPSEGEARVFGLDSWHESFKIRQRLGVLHEKPAYPGNFTAERYLQHVANLYELQEPKKATGEILKEIGLSEAKSKQIKTYSAGMTQRLGLAQALIGNPELAILDEPTANLDPMGRIEFLEKIRELHQEREVSFFLSTHILPELEKVCDWVSIINDGVVVDQGNMEDLVMKYSAGIYRIEVSDPAIFLARLRETETVDKVWLENGILFCKVRNPEKFYVEVPKLAFELKLGLKSLQPMHRSLEEIFKTTLEEETE
jgi:ABC-2 type transport system ATP-binding protein